MGVGNKAEWFLKRFWRWLLSYSLKKTSLAWEQRAGLLYIDHETLGSFLISLYLFLHLWIGAEVPATRVSVKVIQYFLCWNTYYGVFSGLRRLRVNIYWIMMAILLLSNSRHCKSKQNERISLRFLSFWKI